MFARRSEWYRWIMGRDSAEHLHPVDPERVARARERVPTRQEGDRLTSVLSLMADPTRARLLYALDVVDELCVGDLAIALSVTEDAVSYGLRVLRTAGLVKRRKEGRIVYYQLADRFPEPLREHCLRQLVELSRASLEEEGEAVGAADTNNKRRPTRGTVAPAQQGRRRS